VAVNTGEGWLLHCGDPYFHYDEVATRPSCPPGLRLIEIFVRRNAKAPRHNQDACASWPASVATTCG
jgi:hypothetical protein